MEYNEIFQGLPNKWGFKQNPYTTKELKDDEVADLFIGRRDEKFKFFRMIESGTDAFCIGGDFGIGKSSFFNRCTYEIKEVRSDFIIGSTIKVVETKSVENFLKDILEVVIEEIEPHINELSDDAKNTVEEIKGTYNITEGSTETIEGKTPIIPIFSRGHARHKSKSIQKSDTSELPNKVIRRLEELSNIISGELNMKFIISLNNLEKAKIKEKGKVLNLIENLRDLIFTHYFFVFIGDENLREWFETRGRLRSVIGNTIKIGPLTMDEFKQAVKARLDYNAQCLFSLESDYRQYLKEGNIDNKLKKEFEHNKEFLSNEAKVFKTDKTTWGIVDGRRRYRIKDAEANLDIYDLQYTVPFDDDIMEYVYKRIRGDIRWAFNLLHMMFQEIINKEKEIRTYSITDETIKHIICDMAKMRYGSLEDSEKNIIDKLAKIDSASPSDENFQEMCNRSQPTLQKILTKLAKQPELIAKTTEGRKHKYELGYEMKILKEEKPDWFEG